VLYTGGTVFVSVIFRLGRFRKKYNKNFNLKKNDIYAYFLCHHNFQIYNWIIAARNENLKDVEWTLVQCLCDGSDVVPIFIPNCGMPRVTFLMISVYKAVCSAPNLKACIS